MSYGVGRRQGSDTVLLWLWCRPAATAPIKPLAWEPPYAVEVALEKAKRQKKKKERKKENDYILFIHSSADGCLGLSPLFGYYE